MLALTSTVDKLFLPASVRLKEQMCNLWGSTFVRLWLGVLISICPTQHHHSGQGLTWWKAAKKAGDKVQWGISNIINGPSVRTQGCGDLTWLIRSDTKDQIHFSFIQTNWKEMLTKLWLKKGKRAQFRERTSNDYGTLSYVFGMLVHCLWVRFAYLRNKLAQFDLDDGILKLNFKQLGISLTSFNSLTGMRGEDSQHPHVTSHYNFVCKFIITKRGNSRENRGYYSLVAV